LKRSSNSTNRDHDSDSSEGEQLLCFGRTDCDGKRGRLAGAVTVGAALHFGREDSVRRLSESSKADLNESLVSPV
jgi:hypothetical protein